MKKTIGIILIVGLVGYQMFSSGIDISSFLPEQLTSLINL